MPMDGHPPSGTVTFLLTDLEGSTRLWEQDPEAMKAAMARHDELLEKTIAAHRGFVFARMGDGMAASFSTARDAVCAAEAIRSALAAERWGTDRPLRTRVGLHTGEASIVGDTGYTNLPINRCSRLMTAAHGGQILVSGATEMLLRRQLPDGIKLTDLGEHRLRDLGSPMRIFQVEDDGSDDFPPLRTLDAFPGNLPAQVSSFVGRTREAASVTAALEVSRIVTITGVGGVGKTRLALQIAADLLPHYVEGAWLVELGPVRDPGDVVEAVAAVFHLANRGGPSLTDALVEMLAWKRLLLVLDNCEHLLGAVAALVTRIERSCPNVVVLATSREGMSIDGEQLIALPPLSAGRPGDDITELKHTDAVHLFVERARQVKADFELTAANTRAVVDICQRLDGVPLAIELAAARVIALSPAELVARLDQRFRVLAGGRRGAVERHATLRAAIDWSYDLLGESEQRLLARMAVFAGSCSLNAIEEICSGGAVAVDEVLDLVSSLVARSLVVAEHSDLGTRYRLLETIRQYGEERLAEWAEIDTLVIWHARYFAALSARASESSYGPEQLTWARQINLDRENIRAALATAIDGGDVELAVQLVADHPHRQSHAVAPTGEELLVPVSRVLAMTGAVDEPGYPRLLVVAAQQVLSKGDPAACDELCRRALDAEYLQAAPGKGPRIELDVCALRAQASLSAGDYVGAVAGYQRAADIAFSDGYPGLAAICLSYAVSTSLLGGGDVDEAVANAEQAVAAAKRSGMATAVVWSLNSLAISIVESDPERAASLLRESIGRIGALEEGMSSGLLTACMVAGRLRDWDITLALTGRLLFWDRWFMAPLQVATCLAECARALAIDSPEIAGVLQGAAYATFRRASPISDGASRSKAVRVGPNANFVLIDLRETGDLVAAALGEERAATLRTEGGAMSMDEAISHALTAIDPRLLAGPIANIVR